jgi:hypothetical protein
MHREAYIEGGPLALRTYPLGIAHELRKGFLTRPMHDISSRHGIARDHILCGHPL